MDPVLELPWAAQTSDHVFSETSWRLAQAQAQAQAHAQAQAQVGGSARAMMRVSAHTFVRLNWPVAVFLSVQNRVFRNHRNAFSQGISCPLFGNARLIARRCPARKRVLKFSVV